MSKPAGVELRRWFTYMVLLLVFVNLAAVSGGILTYISVRSVAMKLQPFAAEAGSAERFTLLAQRDMYEYLSELSDSNESTVKMIDQLMNSLEGAKEKAPSSDKASEIAQIKALAAQYRLAVEQLPNAMKGARDWSRVEEIRLTAKRIGGEVVKRTSDLASWSQDQIRSKNETLAMLTAGAMVTFLLVFILSVIVLLALRHWWTRFQDSLLGL